MIMVEMKTKRSYKSKTNIVRNKLLSVSLNYYYNYNISNVQPKKYVESLLEAAKAAAVYTFNVRRKTPYGKYLLSIYYNCEIF